MAVAFDFYNRMMDRIAKTHIGNINLSPSTATTYAETYLFGNKVTIGANATIKCPDHGVPLMIVADTVELYGWLQAGYPAAGGNSGNNHGGYSAGSVIVAARSIVGNGSISANAQSGGLASSPHGTNAGVDGGAAMFLGNADPTSMGKGATNDAPGPGGTPSLPYDMFMYQPEWLFLGHLNALRIFAASGGSGSTNQDGSVPGGSGGGGGASFYAKGGDGGSTGYAASYTGNGAGGGGAGGLIMLISANAIPNLGLGAAGGVGGDGYYDAVNSYAAGPGGGGGGGVVRILAPGSAASTWLRGGPGGRPASGSVQTAGGVGANGVVLLTPLS